jgi:biofilm PGA synthesis N-glycosyltransferase PgaC
MFDLLNINKQLLTQNWSLYLFFIVAVAVFIQLIYYYFVYFRVTLHRHKKTEDINRDVSVVICARNEEQNLIDNLPKLVSQNYSNYEVFIILDACIDGSLDLMKNLVKEYSCLRYTVIVKDDKFTHGKKLALTVGIKGAKSDKLLLTDADCYPASQNWITRMAYHFNAGYDIVLGYGKYKPQKGFLNRIIRYDTFFIGQQYLGMALSGLPYMGVGRNLAYKRSVYDAQGGFSKHSHIESGDDDLLINAAANRNNCTIEIHPDAHTISKAPETFKRWRNQKGRHLRASAMYKKRDKFLLAFEPFTRLIVWFAPIPLYFVEEWCLVALALSLLRFIVFMTILKLNMRKLNEKGIWLLAPIFDIILPLFTFGMMLSNRFRKRSIPWR